MTGRQILRLDHAAAARTIELEQAAPLWIGREGELVARRIDERPVDFARVAVVDERPLLVVAVGRRELVCTGTATPALGIEIDLEILRHRNFHVALSWSVQSKSPEPVTSKRQPAGSLMVKKGPSITAGPADDAPAG